MGDAADDLREQTELLMMEEYMAKKATRRSSTRSSRSTREPREESRERFNGDDRGSRGGSRGGNRGGNSDFVSLTKLFETKKNPDLLVGTVNADNIGKLVDLIEEAGDAGITLFVNLQGKWGPFVSATVAQDRGNGGDRASYDRGNDRGRSGRPRF